MVGDVVTLITALSGIAAAAAAIAKHRYDYKKTCVLAEKASPEVIHEIAKVAFPRYVLGPFRRGPVDQAGDAAPDDPQKGGDEEPEGGDEPPDPPPNS